MTKSEQDAKLKALSALKDTMRGMMADRAKKHMAGGKLSASGEGKPKEDDTAEEESKDSEQDSPQDMAEETGDDQTHAELPNKEMLKHRSKTLHGDALSKKK